MKTIYLLRHGEALFNGYDDFDRPLSPVGRDEINKAGKELASAHKKPDLVLYSPAQRTFESVQIIKTHLGTFSIYKEEKRLYAAPVIDILNIIQIQDDGYDVLLIIAHNPGLSDLTIELTPLFPTLLSTGDLLPISLEINSWCETGLL